MPETRYLKTSADVEVRGDGPKKIVGYAAVFFNGSRETEFDLWDDVTERVMPGAFDRALRETDDVRALYNHDPNHVLGRTSAGTLRLSVDAKGLRYEIDAPDSAAGMIESMSRGDVRESSFSFDLTKKDQVWRKDGGRTIREIVSVSRLHDVGPVAFAAYAGTTAEARTAFEAFKAESPISTPDLHTKHIRLIEMETECAT